MSDGYDERAFMPPQEPHSRALGQVFQHALSWEKYRAKGVEILRLSDGDVDKFRRIAIPEWFKWANKGALAREAFASQLDFMRSGDVAYLTDSMLVDEAGRKLTLQ